MKNLKKLEILHLNDFHSDFYPKDRDGKKTGGISYLSDYVRTEKSNDDNVLFFFSGDAIGDDINDSEYQGITTFVMLDTICIDAMCPGNHEVDYGVPQLATVKQMVRFPIVCANINVYINKKKFLDPYILIEKGGLKIFVIGIITNSIANKVEFDKSTYQAFYVNDYNEDIDKMYDTQEYKEADIVVILSHIGYDEDIKLAQKLRNDKFTIIIGGHSHTLLEEPKYVNNIPIVQTGIGSSRIGKFNLYYDEKSKKIENIEYEIVVLNEDNCHENPKYDEYLNILKSETDTKYGNVVCTISRKILNGDRNKENDFCDYFADVFNVICGTDLFLIDPGCTKAKSIGPVIKYGDLKEYFPRVNELIKCTMTGKQLKQLFSYTLEHYGVSNEEDIFLQHPSSEITVIFDKDSKELISLLYKDIEVKDDDLLSVGLFDYSLMNSQKKFSLKTEDIIKNNNIVSKHPNLLEALKNYLIDCSNDQSVYEVEINKRYIAK